jgi:hypothetical protein
VTEKLGVETATVAGRLGWESGLEILDANESTLRRDHHLALVATEGSGVESVYAFAVAQGCDAEALDIQTLVLCASDERAGRVARALQSGWGRTDSACSSQAPGGRNRRASRLDPRSWSRAHPAYFPPPGRAGWG